MNSPESTDAAHNDEQAAGLWRGDAGGLKLDARRALVQLLKGPVLDGMRMPVIWKALLESEDLIRSRLNDLFLDLVIDREQLFAFTRQADTDPVKAPILLKRKPLNYIETYLFLFLRLRLSSAEGRGERAVIGLDEIREHLADIAGRNRDAVGFERHLAGAVTKADHFGVLRRLKSGEDAFEISPVLKMLMTAELVEQVKDYYEGRAAKPPKFPPALKTTNPKTKTMRRTWNDRSRAFPRAHARRTVQGRAPAGTQLGHLLGLQRHSDRRRGLSLRGRLGLGQVDASRRLLPAADSAPLGGLQRRRA